MTNEPEPNTRAGEALKPCLHCGSANIEFMASATWRSSDRAMCGNCGMQGPISSWNTRPQPELEWLGCNAGNTRHLPQPSELVDLIERLESHMGKQDPQILLADCREAALELRAQSAQIAKLQADGDKLAEAAEPFVDNMAYLDWLEAADDDYVDRPTKSAGDYRRLFQALTEWKDRA